MNVQIKPMASNSFTIELFNYKGEVKLTLEIQTSELKGKQRLNILQRKDDFKPFHVLIRDFAKNPLEEKEIAVTHEITIEE